MLLLFFCYRQAAEEKLHSLKEAREKERMEREKLHKEKMAVDLQLSKEKVEELQAEREKEEKEWQRRKEQEEAALRDRLKQLEEEGERELTMRRQSQMQELDSAEKVRRVSEMEQKAKLLVVTHTKAHSHANLHVLSCVVTLCMSRVVVSLRPSHRHMTRKPLVWPLKLS